MFPLELFKVQAQHRQKCPHSSPKPASPPPSNWRSSSSSLADVILFPLSTHLPAPKSLLFLSHVTRYIFIVLQTEWTTTTPLLEKNSRSCFLSHVRLLLGHTSQKDMLTFSPHLHLTDVWIKTGKIQKSLTFSRILLQNF